MKDDKCSKAKNVLLGTIALFLVFLFSACSAKPSEADGKKAFEDGSYFRRDLKEGSVAIKGFKKVNGQTMEAFGVKLYKMEYEAEIEYLKEEGGFLFPPYIYKKGDIRRVKGTIMFEQTEKGWKVRDVTIPKG